MVAIKLLSEHIRVIYNHAESTYPEECCGIILGTMNDIEKTVVEVWQTENVWGKETAGDFLEAETITDKRRRYAIAPVDLLKAQKTARDLNLNIIGIFHSHTDHPAIPSEFDRTYAWQGYSYIIVSVQQGKSDQMQSWYLDDSSQFQPEEIVTVD